MGLVAIALLVAMFYVPMRHEPEQPLAGSAIFDAPEFDRLLGRESQPLPLRVERNEETLAVAELQGTDPKMRIYQLPSR